MGSRNKEVEMMRRLKWKVHYRTGNSIGQILKIEGKNQKATNPALTGDIVAVAKLKATTTGDTLCDEKHPVTFAQVQMPEPVMQLALEPKWVNV